MLIMDHSYIVQYRYEREVWRDDMSFPTLKEALDFAVNEAATCPELEHRVVGAEYKTLAIFNRMDGEDYK